ncbi:MAG TPA: hypothetical protein VHN80_28865 [Kineosporiaceae bacterium]|jgi:hypothetical protein|nr:hypothetical protein [Kineosporiaceae bacterium]
MVCAVDRLLAVTAWDDLGRPEVGCRLLGRLSFDEFVVEEDRAALRDGVFVTPRCLDLTGVKNPQEAHLFGGDPPMCRHPALPED